MRFNPFVPTSIVGPGMFSGRLDELRELDRVLFQTREGNPKHFLIHGERGIGKSSLLLVAKAMSKGELKGFESGATYRFVTVEVEVGANTTHENLTKKVGADLARRLKEVEAIKTAAKGVWGFLTRWEVLGVKYDASAPQTDASALLEELVETIVEATSRLKLVIDGVIVLIDEADNATEATRIGEWVKVFTERLTKRGCNHCCLGLSGISTVIETLRASHESSPRALNHILLEPLQKQERIQVVQLGLKKANERNKQDTAVTAQAAEWIAVYSEGYPHFIQQYAFCAFESDTDFNIDVDDVQLGAFKENGALDQLGTRYFEEMYRAQINSDDYRKVLHVMAESEDKFITKQHIREQTGLKETTLGNALQTLRSRQIIFSHPDKQGVYRLPNDSFAAWVKAQIKREREKSDRKAF